MVQQWTRLSVDKSQFHKATHCRGEALQTHSCITCWHWKTEATTICTTDQHKHLEAQSSSDQRVCGLNPIRLGVRGAISVGKGLQVETRHEVHGLCDIQESTARRNTDNLSSEGRTVL